MSELPPFDDVSMYAETHARCIAAQDRASEALRRAAIALKNAEAG